MFVPNFSEKAKIKVRNMRCYRRSLIVLEAVSV